MRSSFVSLQSRMNWTGFPHSDTAGSKLRGSYPTTIAAMYVLLRQHMPRYPLFALLDAWFHTFSFFKEKDTPPQAGV